MRLTLPENDVLKEMAATYPTASSIAKLVKATGRARNDIGEAVDGLCALKLVNKTDKNEVYLLASGRDYLGLSSDGPSKPEVLQRPSVNTLPEKSEQLTKKVKNDEKQ